MPGSKVLLVVIIDGKVTFFSSWGRNMVSFGCMSSLRDHFISSVIYLAGLIIPVLSERVLN